MYLYFTLKLFCRGSQYRVSVDIKIRYKCPPPKKFENGIFTLKIHQIFSVDNVPERFENTTITGHFEFVL